ncbi:MAG: GGDEF domain-containing protein [Bacteroidales bacterium]|nr:GGDEF domain-containing protein [Clostridium sp.]MCM1204268.1 GGDEF domain-containing protein [Bacteroidales bacterium]
MKQFQMFYKDDEGFLEKLEEIKKWCASHSAYVTIFRIYSEDMELEHIQHICDCLDKEMPDALYLGCTANANIMNGVLTKEKIILTCTIFEYGTTQARILQMPFSEENAAADVAALKACCDENPWVQAVEMHATIMDMSMMEFCNEMSGLPKDIQVFGGGAFNPDMDDDTAAVFSKGNGFLEHGIIFLLLGGTDFHAYSTFISGWKPLKRKFRVTKADRELLYELDGKPALDVYRKFLNINRNDSFFSNTLEFPLFLEHGDVDILRCPLAANDDGSLVMSSDIQEDAIVRLAYGDPETILASIREDGQKIADFCPEVIQTFSCAARRAFWSDENISGETVIFNSVAPTTGFYTHGEFLRMKGDMLNFNVTLVIVAMREGNMPETDKIVNIAKAQIDNGSNEKIPIIRRFVSFIEASTAELEEMNMKLAMSSVTDGLTRLYNRAEIERKIHSALDKRNQQGTGDISLIMLDIDNFKKVNDIYGHKEGDHVIQALSDVLRKKTTGVHSCSLGRWGGEEFMVLLTDSNADDAAALAEEIRQEFASVTYEAATCQTVSIGVTQAKKETADELYNRVDKALYMAKAAGKNQVVRLD